MTIWKIFKRSFILDQSQPPSFIRLEMTFVWSWMGTFWWCAFSNMKMNTPQSFLYCVWTNWARNVRLAANESSFEYLLNDLWFQLISCTGNDKNQWKTSLFKIFLKNLQFMHRFWHHYLLFTIKSKIIDENSWDLWHWLHLMTLFPYLRKKIPKTHFFHEKYLIEQLFPFLWFAVYIPNSFQ